MTDRTSDAAEVVVQAAKNLLDRLYGERKTDWRLRDITVERIAGEYTVKLGFSEEEETT